MLPTAPRIVVRYHATILLCLLLALAHHWQLLTGSVGLLAALLCIVVGMLGFVALAVTPACRAYNRALSLRHRLALIGSVLVVAGVYLS